MARRTKKSALVALLATGALTLGAMPSLSAPAVIKAKPSSWDPGTLRIPKGKRVVWKNPISSISGQTHNVRAYGGNWTYKKALPLGGSVTRRFRRVGTFRFLCTIHGSLRRVDGKLVCRDMCGKVRVHRR